MATGTTHYIPTDQIDSSAERRKINPETVDALAKSIKALGLQHPVTVRTRAGRKDKMYRLVAGLHRLEAHRRLGIKNIQAVVVRWSDVDAEMWEISENLHRSDLTVTQRAEHIERWRKLKQLSQLATIKPGPKSEGVRDTAADLGITADEVSRAKHIASITDAAKAAAKDVGLDDNQSALLKIAKEEPEEQTAKVYELAEAKKTRFKFPTEAELESFEEEAVLDDQDEWEITRLMEIWETISKAAQREFLSRIGAKQHPKKMKIK